MKGWKALSMVSLVLGWAGAALAQDAVKVDPAHYKVVFENAGVRVLRINYAPGAKSSMHQHPASIVVPLAASKVRFALPDGKSELSELANESAMYMPAGTHEPTNVGSGSVDALLIEFKTAAPGKAALPASRPGMDITVLAEGPRATAYRSTAAGDLRGTGRDHARIRPGRHRARTRPTLALDRRQTRENGLGSGRRAVRRPWRGARGQEHRRKTGGHGGGGYQVDGTCHLRHSRRITA